VVYPEFHGITLERHSLHRTLDFAESLTENITRHDILFEYKIMPSENVAGLMSDPDESSDGGGLR